MPEHEQLDAWLEKDSGEIIPVGASFSFGRSSSCDLTLQDSKVSRKHAVINRQSGSEYWLSDLGSANGTYVNQMRIGQPTRLRSGDELRVGPFYLKFQRPTDEEVENATQMTTQQTIIDLRHERRWLLVADIENSTMLASSLDPATYRGYVDEWFSRSRDVIARNKGGVNKYLGDGFIACWPDAENVPDRVAAAIEEFRAMRNGMSFRFRLVLHFGEIIIGGLGTNGEESLAGPEVNFAFRMEKVAGTNGYGIMLSRSAAEALGERFKKGEPRKFPVPGFAGEHVFFEG